MFRIILMCLLTCCSSFMPLKLSESKIFEDHTQIVEKKTRDNYVKTASGYYEYGTSDLFSYDFLRGLINYYVDDLGVTDVGFGNTNVVNQYVIQSSGIYKIFGYQPYVYYELYSVSNFVITKNVLSQPSNLPVFEYTFIMSNSSPYNLQIGIHWYGQRTINDLLTIYGVELVVPSGSIPIPNTTAGLTRDELYTYFMLSEKIDSYNSFIGNIFQSLNSEPQQIAYNQGYNDGFNVGYDSGVTNGYEDGYTAGQSAGYQTGFQAGVDDTISGGTEAMTIFSGIMDVAFIPVNVFFLMFNYEVFGINIAGFVSGLLTIAIVIIIFKFILGRKI